MNDLYFIGVPISIGLTLVIMLILFRKKLAHRMKVVSDAKLDRVVWKCGVYNYLPISYLDMNGNARGILVELFQEIAENMNIQCNFVPFSYSNFYSKSPEKLDMVVGLFDTKRRRERMVFSKAVYEIGLQGVCKSDKEIYSEDQLKNESVRVAVYYGEIGWEYVEDEIPQAERQKRLFTVAAGEQVQAINQLKYGEADIILTDELACVSFLQESDNLDKYKLALPRCIKSFDCGFAISMARKDRLNEIDENLTKIRNSKNFLKIEAQAINSLGAVLRQRSLTGKR